MPLVPVFLTLTEACRKGKESGQTHDRLVANSASAEVVHILVSPTKRTLQTAVALGWAYTRNCTLEPVAGTADLLAAIYRIAFIMLCKTAASVANRWPVATT